MLDVNPPFFDLRDTFDTTIPIGDHVVPIHVKRFSRMEMEAFEQGWATYIVEPRGADTVEMFRRRVEQAPKDGAVVLSTIEAAAVLARVDRAPEAPLPAEAGAQFKVDTLRFIESAIVEALTVDEGLIRDRGIWVTTGAGFLDVFHARKDVLVTAVSVICAQNRLSEVIRKNLNSPRASEPGSGQSNPARGGDGQGRTAGNVEPSSARASVDVTGPSDPLLGLGLASSGVIHAVK